MNFPFKDLIPEIALDLNLTDLNKLCLTSKKFNEVVCNSSLFWQKRLRQDFPNIDITNVLLEDTKNLYKYLKSRARVVYTKLKKYSSISPGAYSNYIINHFSIQNKLVRKYSLRKGDVVIFKEMEEIKNIWMGENFETTGKYFFLPESLNFPEFPPYYWEYEMNMDFVPVAFERITEALSTGYLLGKYGEKYKVINREELNDVDDLADLDTLFVRFLNYQVEIV